MRDRSLGAAILVLSCLAFIGYIILLFTNFEIAVIIIMIIAVGAVCGILAWIGYTLVTTPAPSIPETPPEAETKTEEKKEK
ncbi:MAG: transcriptional regulator [Candidatus Bathyarchaeota archaeon]